MKKIFLVLILLGSLQLTFSQVPCIGTPTVSYINKVYNTVQIGTQCWLKENLNIGTIIKGSSLQYNNGVLEKYCYDDDPTYCDKYGGLYTWDEAMKYTPSGSKVQGICPSGWRLPTLDDFKILQSYVKHDAGALKDTILPQGSVKATNSSGFTALLAGSRGNIRSNGSYFSHIAIYAFYWSSIEFDALYAPVMELDYINNDINLYNNGKAAAFSVRCIKGDGVTNVPQNYGQNSIPSHFELYQNYPNPFNPSTTIKFALPQSANVKVTVFDIAGKEIQVLVNAFMNAGIHQVQFNANNLASGIYTYKIQSDNFVKVNKMLLVK